MTWMQSKGQSHSLALKNKQQQQQQKGWRIHFNSRTHAHELLTMMDREK